MQLFNILAVLGLAAVACAFENIAVQDTVQAGTDTQGTIANDIGKGSGSFDAGFNNYRIYLAMTPPGWGTGPSCTLINNTAIDKTTFTIKIPAEVGPDGDVYSLATVEYNTDPNKDGPSGYQYSNTVNLQGATGNWSQFELDGLNFIDPDSILCSGYGCARSCASKFYPGNKGEKLADWIPTQECINACPGVVPVDVSAFSSSNGTSSGSIAESSSSAITSASTSTQASATPSASTTLSRGGQTGSATGSATAATSTGAASTLKTSLGNMIWVLTAALFAFA